MVTPQLEEFARRLYFDAFAAMLLAPVDDEVLAHLGNALQAVKGLATEVGVSTSELDAESPLPGLEALEAERDAVLNAETGVSALESSYSGDENADLANVAAWQTLEVEILQSFGAEPEHIGLEMAAMALFILKDRPADGDAFFQARLAKTLPAFAAALSKHPKADFMKRIAPFFTAIADIEHWRRESRH